MGVEVTGVAENSKALKAAGDVNTEEAGHQAALALTPYLQAATRTDTGELRSGWQAVKDSFVNEVDYAAYQEYGTVWVTGTHAIDTAVSGHEEAITKAFEKATDDATHKAGY
jgi:nitroreductase